MQESGATAASERERWVGKTLNRRGVSFSFFLGEKGVRLGLVEGEEGRLGLVLVVICLRLHIPFSAGVSS
jgi:hypothetical protein